MTMIIEKNRRFIVNTSYFQPIFRSAIVEEVRCYREIDGKLSVQAWVDIETTSDDDCMGWRCWVDSDKLYNIT